MQTRTNALSLFKQTYMDMMVNLLNNETRLYNRWNVPPKKMWAGKLTIDQPLIIGRSQAFGATVEGGQLPEPQSVPLDNLQVPIRFHNGRIGITAQLMKLARENKAAFASGLEFVTDQFRDGFLDYINEVLWSDGRGIQARVSVAGADTTTLQVKDPMGVPGAVNGARFLQPTMRIAILSSDGLTLLAVRRVESIAANGLSVTLNSPVSATEAPVDALVVRAPSMTVNDIAQVHYLKDAMGMLGIVDDGGFVNDYFGVNRTNQPLAQANVFPSVGALNLDTLQQLHDVCEQLGGGKITEHWMHYSIRRAYLVLTVANRRFISSGGPTNFDVGFKGAALDEVPTINGKPIRVDKDAPYGMWFAMDWRKAVKYPHTEFEWADEDGSTLDRTPGVDSFESVARMWFNCAHSKPLTCGRLDGIDANIVTAHVR